MLFKFLCLAAVFVKVENNDKINAKLPNAVDAFETVVKSWYPEGAEFNESCVLQGCQALNNFRLCHKPITITILHNVLKTAIGCMKKPICGILIDRRPTPSLTFTTEDWLPSLDLVGKGTILPDEGCLTNVANIDLETLPDHNLTNRMPLTLTMFISNMQHFGKFNLDLSFHHSLQSLRGQALSVTIPKIKYSSELQYYATISFNYSLTGTNFDIKLLNPTLSTNPIFRGIDIPKDFARIPSLLTSMTHRITKKSSWAVRKAAFLEKYFQSAIRSVANRC